MPSGGASSIPKGQRISLYRDSVTNRLVAEYDQLFDFSDELWKQNFCSNLFISNFENSSDAGKRLFYMERLFDVALKVRQIVKLSANARAAALYKLSLALKDAMVNAMSVGVDLNCEEILASDLIGKRVHVSWFHSEQNDVEFGEGKLLEFCD